jgi:hypothetical protein
MSDVDFASYNGLGLGRKTYRGYIVVSDPFGYSHDQPNLLEPKPEPDVVTSTEVPETQNA